VAQDGTGELGEEAFDQVEPRTVLRREGERKAAVRLSGEPRFGLPGDVSGMIVEDQLDRGIGWIGGVEKFEELDELATAMAILDQGMDLSGEEIDPGEETERAVALVLEVAREAWIDPRLGRQIRCCVRDCLETGSSEKSPAT